MLGQDLKAPVDSLDCSPQLVASAKFEQALKSPLSSQWFPPKAIFFNLDLFSSVLYSEPSSNELPIPPLEEAIWENQCLEINDWRKRKNHHIPHEIHLHQKE